MTDLLTRTQKLLTRFGGPVALLALVFLCSITILVPISYNLMREISAKNPDALLLDAILKEPTAQSESIFAGETLPGELPPPEPWDGSQRVTILLLGLDFRDWEVNAPSSRSDTMILLTVDPGTKTGGILSVPRDLWAVIPGFDAAKINTAYYLGDAYKVPGGGPGLAIKTVESVVGVPIDYYAQIDFDAFINFIDLLHGIKVVVPERIKVDPLGYEAWDTYLEPGPNLMPGDITLAYARARNTRGHDFDRAARQQQVILGIKNRILQLDLLPSLIANAPEIYAELASGIHTNLPLETAIKLAVLGTQIDNEDIKTGIIGQDYVINARSPDNLAILIPRPDKIRILRDEIFASTSSISPLTIGTDLERMQLEFASISLQNGSSEPNLGTRTAEYLRNNGANIVAISAANNSTQVTSIIDHTGNPFTMTYLTNLMRVDTLRITQNLDLNSSVDVEVILGNDWRLTNPLP